MSKIVQSISSGTNTTVYRHVQVFCFTRQIYGNNAKACCKLFIPAFVWIDCRD